MIFFFKNSIVDFWEAGTSKFYKQGFSEEGRMVIIDFFMTNINLKSIIFGVDFTDLYLQEYLTTHNSFLSLHSRFGIGIVVVFSQMLYIIAKSLKKHRFYLFIIVIILLRSTTDSVLISDGFLFGIVFYVIYFQLFKITNVQLMTC